MAGRVADVFGGEANGPARKRVGLGCVHQDVCLKPEHERIDFVVDSNWMRVSLDWEIGHGNWRQDNQYGKSVAL